MRYGPGQKSETKRRILLAATRQVRKKGPDRLVVSEVMSSAGLTHGAFYAHFSSKADLVAEAVSEMFADAAGRAGGLGDLPGFEGEELGAALRGHIESYVSPSHRDSPDHGCPLPALAADIVRIDDRARRNFVAGMEQMIERMASVLDGLGRPRPKADARALVAQMVGAIALARAAGAGEQSDGILRDCRDAIITQFHL